MKKILCISLFAPLGCVGAPGSSELRVPRPSSDFEAPAAPRRTTTAAKLREFFPEALLWNPELVTDEQGEATLHVPVADSITTWRIGATANTRQGHLGFGEATFRAFKELFVEPDLPPVLTQGDRISLPVAVYNFLEREEQVLVSLAPDDWYDLGDDRARKVRVPPKGALSVMFDLHARRPGTHDLLIEARGEGRESVDAVRRAVTVWPDGRERTHVFNARVSGRTTLSIEPPADALPGSARLVCKCYPGVFGSVLDGLEAMLRKPHG